VKVRGPEVIKISSELGEEEAAIRAAQVVRDGGLVVYPTESFYGLGADPQNEEALRRIFALKGRGLDSPILLLLPSREYAGHYAAVIPNEALALMEVFWPGGLTIVLDAAEGVSPLLTAGTGKIGLRLSGHPFARALCRAFGGAITGTSANRTGGLPSVTALEACESLGGEVQLVVDAGSTPGGLPSTVVDASRHPPRIIRSGMIGETELKRVVPAVGGTR
jgi:L-threonylcarbamoyladenylate synthase